METHSHPSSIPSLFLKGSRIAMALGLMSLGGLSSVTAAPIVANFSDGNTTAAVDGWQGMAGDGWSSAWADARNQENTASTILATTDNPFPDGGYRLGATLTSTHGSARGLTVGRRYNGVSLDAAQTISFDVRIDSGMDSARRFYFFDTTLANPTLSAEADTTTWVVRVDANGIIRLGNGRNESNAAVFFTVPTSSIRLSEETPYRFTIEVNPSAVAAESSYTVRIENLSDSSEFYQSAALSFIGNHTSTGGNLNFYSSLNGVTSETSLTYSLDNIMVVPESSTMALVMAGLVSVGATRLLRSRR